MGTVSKRIVMVMFGRKLFVLNRSKPFIVFACQVVDGCSYNSNYRSSTELIMLCCCSWAHQPCEWEAATAFTDEHSPCNIPEPCTTAASFQHSFRTFYTFFLRRLEGEMCFPLLLLHYCAFFPSAPLFSNCFNMFENKQCIRVQLAL